MITADNTFNIKIKLFWTLNETRGLLMIHNDQVNYETCLVSQELLAACLMVEQWENRGMLGLRPMSLPTSGSFYIMI